MKKVFQNYFKDEEEEEKQEKKQISGADRARLENACTARGGVWDNENQICYGLKDGKKKPIKDE